jgi:hypothetical protein
MLYSVSKSMIFKFIKVPYIRTYAFHITHKDGIEVFTEMDMKSSVFWVMTLCIPLRVNLRFAGTYYLLLQGRRVNQARNKNEADRK